MAEVCFQPIVRYVDGEPMIESKPAVRDSSGRIIPDPTWVDFLTRARKGEFMDLHQRNMTRSDITELFGYHKANATTAPLHQSVRGEFIHIASTLNRLVPDGRAKSTMMTKLQEAAMWANFGIAEVWAPVVDE